MGYKFAVCFVHKILPELAVQGYNGGRMQLFGNLQARSSNKKWAVQMKNIKIAFL